VTGILACFSSYLIPHVGHAQSKGPHDIHATAGIHPSVILAGNVTVGAYTTVDTGTVLTGIVAIGNGGGRTLAGFLCDKIGRKITMFAFFVFQALLLVVLSQAKAGTVLASAPCLILIVALIGAHYGSDLALFPSITKDHARNNFPF